MSILIYVRDHPFKTSAFLRGVGVKNWPNLPTNSSKKTATDQGFKNRENLPMSSMDGPLYVFSIPYRFGVTFLLHLFLSFVKCFLIQNSLFRLYL